MCECKIDFDALAKVLAGRSDRRAALRGILGTGPHFPWNSDSVEPDPCDPFCSVGPCGIPNGMRRHVRLRIIRRKLHPERLCAAMSLVVPILHLRWQVGWVCSVHHRSMF